MARVAYKNAWEAQKADTARFEKCMESLATDNPKPYQPSHCYNSSRWTLKSRQLQAKVIKYFLNHPTETYTSIERKFWLWSKYMARLLDRYPKIKMKIAESRDKEILNMYEDVLYDIAEITAKNVRKYKETDDKLRTNELKDLSAIAKDTNERKNLMEGKPTENQNINITIN